MTRERLRELLDYDPLTGLFTWRVKSAARIRVGDVAGSRDPRGYIRIRVDNKHYWAHRIAWLWMTGDWPEKSDIDHINLVKSDNRWSNLREVDRAENMWNRKTPCHNTSNFKGVSFDTKSGKFAAYIEHRKQRFRLGHFATAKEAAAMFEGAAKLIRGEFHHAN